jgi:hypothetical protein
MLPKEPPVRANLWLQKMVAKKRDKPLVYLAFKIRYFTASESTADKQGTAVKNLYNFTLLHFFRP